MSRKVVQSKNYYRYFSKSELMWINLAISGYALTFNLDSIERKELNELSEKIHKIFANLRKDK